MPYGYDKTRTERRCKNCDKIYLLKDKEIKLLKNNKLKEYFENQK